MQAIALVALLLPLALGLTVPASDSHIVYSGRVTKEFQFEWSGVVVSLAFQGSSSVSAVFTEQQGNMYNVFIDGMLVMWLNTTGGTKTYNFTSGLTTGAHVLQITKRTEAFFGTVTFGGFVLDDGASLLPYAAPQRKIEFIGDSITCGYGDLGKYPCSFSAETEDNYLSYGPVTARALNAELHLEAWSGMGMVRNYGDKNDTSRVPFPSLFPYVLPTGPSAEWSFPTWVPQVVVINLGTNDFSTQPWPPAEVYESAYTTFIKTYSNTYNPTPKFFLVCGPMQNSETCPYVQSVAEATGATYISLENLLDFPADFGCDYHPAVSGHAKMANATITAIRSVMNW